MIRDARLFSRAFLFKVVLFGGSIFFFAWSGFLGNLMLKFCFGALLSTLLSSKKEVKT